MKLVVDLQGAQSGSRLRGIGRYSQSLVEALACKAGNHELMIALSGAFPNSIESLRPALEKLVPRENIVVWEAVTPVAAIKPLNTWRRLTGEILRESFLASLDPDIVHVSSLFEGFSDDALTSVARDGRYATSLTLYDLIPLSYPEWVNDEHSAWYQQKLDCLRRGDLWLAISEYSRQDGISRLGLPEDRVVNISSAADEQFHPISLRDDEAHEILKRYGIARPFVMFTGAAEERKNLRRLLGAYRLLPTQIQQEHQLLVVFPVGRDEIDVYREIPMLQGLEGDTLVVVPRVPDRDLIALYNLCAAFCFPSLHEGFGLPALEAMQCGAPVIGAKASSVPEVIGCEDALFDPYDERAIAERLYKVLTDSNFAHSLTAHGLQQARRFSWNETARRAWDAFEAIIAERQAPESFAVQTTESKPSLAYVSLSTGDHDASLLSELARHYAVDLITNQRKVDVSSMEEIKTHDVQWFKANGGRYDRILYTIDNFDSYDLLIDLLEQHHGVVVLHDFDFGEGFCQSKPKPEEAQSWLRALYESHGYLALQEWTKNKNYIGFSHKYPANFGIIQRANGVIVTSEACRERALELYGKAIARHLVSIPQTSLDTGKDSSYPVDERPAPTDLGDRYRAAIERFSTQSIIGLRDEVVAALVAVEPRSKSKEEWVRLACALGENLQLPRPQRQLLVDISVLARVDSGTGIQRVTRNILRNLLASPPPGYRVEPIYENGQEYHYARTFMSRSVGYPEGLLEDQPVEFAQGDIFLGLDLTHNTVIRQKRLFAHLRAIGATIYFIVYDLLPVHFPHAFPSKLKELHPQWLSKITAYSDGLICISRSVADELLAWLDENEMQREPPLKVGWFHLGSDLDSKIYAPAGNGSEQVLASIRSAPSFLSVSTIEPRKGHSQMLDAFDRLWMEEIEANLVLVGRKGWKVENLIERIENHPQLGKRLFWFEGMSDEDLDQIYGACACLLVASAGEGFGLPLVEAARHKIPVLARDIPVFHEVAGEHASYFSGKSPDDLVQSIKNWLTLYAANQHQKSDNMPLLDWEQSTQKLLAVILEDNWYASWSQPRERHDITDDEAVVQSANTLARMREMLEERDERIAKMNDELEKRDEKIATMRVERQQRDEKIAELRSRISSLHNSGSWRVTAPLRIVSRVVLFLVQVVRNFAEARLKNVPKLRSEEPLYDKNWAKDVPGLSAEPESMRQLYLRLTLARHRIESTK